MTKLIFQCPCIGNVYEKKRTELVDSTCAKGLSDRRPILLAFTRKEGVRSSMTRLGSVQGTNASVVS